MKADVATLRWSGQVDGHLVLLDQTRLPGEIVYLQCRDEQAVWQAIQQLSVRGAPAIGIAAAYGVCVAAQRALDGAEPAVIDQACDYLATSRPTAVNLFWALNRMRGVAKKFKSSGSGTLADGLLAEARAIHQEDREMCAAIGRQGADLLADLPDECGILTHCNAGALATGGDGTALSVIFELARRGKQPQVWVDETRPLLQGARLTAWELQQREIAATLICDSMAAQVMREGRLQAVITGADRIAANGDAANKIGTYSVAVLAQAHGIPFYVAAPTSTFDFSTETGEGIPVEQRAAREITQGFGTATAPEGIAVYNPAFDVTPAELISAIITERAVLRNPTASSLATFMAD